CHPRRLASPRDVHEDEQEADGHGGVGERREDGHVPEVSDEGQQHQQGDKEHHVQAAGDATPPLDAALNPRDTPLPPPHTPLHTSTPHYTTSTPHHTPPHTTTPPPHSTT